MPIGDRHYKKPTQKDDELTQDILLKIRAARGKATVTSLVRQLVPDEYTTVNRTRSRINVRLRTLARQGRIEKLSTDYGVVLKARRC